MSDPLSRTKEIFSKGISAAQQNLESKAKSKRGLSLQDKLTLEVMRLMEASGYANPNSTIYGGIRKSDDPSLILKAKSALNKLTKEELIERLAIAKHPLNHAAYQINHRVYRQPQLDFLSRAPRPSPQLQVNRMFPLKPNL